MNPRQRSLDAGNCFTLDLRIVAASLEPLHIRLPPEPGHLAFGIVAVRLLSGMDRLLASHFPAQKLNCLFIAERSKGTSCFTVLVEQFLCFVSEPGVKHLARAFINARVKCSAVGIEAEPQNAEV